MGMAIFQKRLFGRELIELALIATCLLVGWAPGCAG
jgi:hypothetical protein